MMYQYQFSCDRKNLKAVRDFVTQILRSEQFPENEIPAMVLAIDEVCANLIIHSHAANPNGYIELQLEVSSQLAICEIIDRDGMYYDFSTHKNPDIRQIIREGRKGGVGLMLVKRLVDKVEVERQGTQNTWRLTKQFPHSAVGS